MRVMPQPLDSILACKETGEWLLQMGHGFMPPFICSLKRPQLPNAPIADRSREVGMIIEWRDWHQAVDDDRWLWPHRCACWPPDSTTQPEET
jgi:hypothetical protein